MIRPARLSALATLVLALATAPAFAAGPPAPAPQDAPTEAVEPAPGACAPGPLTELVQDPLPAGHTGEIVCNVECQSFSDDCSHVCGQGQGLCTPLALASGLCWFCDCNL